MTPRDRRNLAIGAILAAILAIFVALRLEVDTDITRFLPAGDERELSKHIAESQLTRTMILTIGAPDTGEAVDAARALEARLRADPEVMSKLSFLEGGPAEGFEKAIWELYFPRRLSFLADTASASRQRLSDEGIRAALEDLRTRLSSPMSAMIARVAPADPFLVLPRLYERIQAPAEGGLRVVDARFVSADPRWAVLFLGTKAPAFEGTVQAPLLASIRRHFEAVRADRATKLELEMTGLNRFAMRAEEGIREDVTRVSTLSTVGLLLLFGALYRSLRAIAVALMTISMGMLAGTATTLLLFGKLHGITLAFGASMIGVCVDYVIHFVNYHSINPSPLGPSGSLARVWPGLLLGCATTVVGFLALAASSFPGLREVAVFAASGLTAALLATRWLAPAFLPRTPRPVWLRERSAALCLRLFDAMTRHKRALWVLPAIALVITFVGLRSVRWDDSLSALAEIDPQLKAEDERVRGRVARFEQQRVVVSVGADEEAALQVNERVALRLEAAVAAKEIGGFRSAYPMLPSAASQRARDHAVRTATAALGRFDAILVEEGYQPELFAPFREALTAPAPPPVVLADLLGSPLVPLVRGSRIDVDDRVGFLSFLIDARDPAALRARLQGIDGAVLVDHGAMMGSASRDYRQQTVKLTILGVFGSLLMIALWSRSLKWTAVAAFPAILAAGMTAAVVAMVGLPLNLLAVMALLIVLSMGVDYGVFLVEASEHERVDFGATLLSIVLACLSTILGFGLLALSSHPALKLIGLTAGVGVTATLLLAPTVLAMTEDR